MQVREMMSQDIEVVDRNDNLRTVEERMAAKQLRHLPPGVGTGRGRGPRDVT